MSDTLWRMMATIVERRLLVRPDVASPSSCLRVVVGGGGGGVGLLIMAMIISIQFDLGINIKQIYHHEINRLHSIYNS